MTMALILVTLLVAGYFLGVMATSAPESLSATYYTLGSRGWVFQVFVAAVASLLFPVWVEMAVVGSLLANLWRCV